MFSITRISELAPILASEISLKISVFLVSIISSNDLSKLKIFASHGSVDQVVPVDWARNSIPKLKELGIDIVYKEYPVGHGVAPQNFFDFKNWLQNR